MHPIGDDTVSESTVTVQSSSKEYAGFQQPLFAAFKSGDLAKFVTARFAQADKGLSAEVLAEIARLTDAIASDKDSTLKAILDHKEYDTVSTLMAESAKRIASTTKAIADLKESACHVAFAGLLADLDLKVSVKGESGKGKSSDLTGVYRCSYSNSTRFYVFERDITDADKPMNTLAVYTPIGDTFTPTIALADTDKVFPGSLTDVQRLHWHLNLSNQPGNGIEHVNMVERRASLVANGFWQTNTGGIGPADKPTCAIVSTDSTDWKAKNLTATTPKANKAK